jgi:hypothetical protein
MGEIVTGSSDGGPETPAHTKGVRQGNSGAHLVQKGHRRDGRSTARRSTGIRPTDRDTQVPGSPNVSPP